MKLFFVSLFLLIAITSSAQRAATIFQPSSNPTSSAASIRNFVDTLKPLSFVPVNQGGLGCFTGYYHSPDSGYVSGNNQYGDLEKAQFFSLTQMGFAKGGTIQSVLVRFAYKTLGEQPESLFVRIYDADTSAIVPRNLLGTSDGIELSAISVGGEGTLFTFPEPIIVTDSFFASVQLPILGGDTAVIQSTNDNCVSHDGWSWEQWSNGTWHAMINSWILNIDLAIFPVAEVETPSGISQVNNDEMISVFPNPAYDQCALSFTNQNAVTEIFLEDLSGRIIKDFGRAKNENMNLNLSSIPEGFYFIIAKNETGWQRKQLCIVH